MGITKRLEPILLGNIVLTRLSEMICGDAQFAFFPYRSSSNLTRFFFDIDLEYTHDGSTRRYWVCDVLKELNARKPAGPGLPSKEIINVIVYLLHPDHFINNDNVDREKAIDALKSCIKTYNLTISRLSNGLVKVCPIHGEFISTEYLEVPTEKLITFKPSIFQIPNNTQNSRLVSVMMPFDASFNGTYKAIKHVTEIVGLECLRADDIWNNSTFIQDIFDLIYCSKIVIVDFSGRNPNVMYETGIAHTLGKIVIPITQSIDDIPTDLRHHRALKYLPNEQGYEDLSNDLYKRFKAIIDNTE